MSAPRYEFQGNLPVRKKLRPQRKPVTALLHSDALLYQHEDGDWRYVCVVPIEVAEDYQVRGEA